MERPTCLFPASIAVMMVLCLLAAGCLADRAGHDAGSPPLPGPGEGGTGSTTTGATGGITRGEAEEIREFWDEVYNPDLEISGTADTDTGKPGETLTYTLKMTNIGTGPATGILISSSYPDGASDTQGVGDLQPGASKEIVLRYRIPLEVQDKSILLLSVNVTGKNLRGDPERNETNNAIRIQVSTRMAAG